MSRAAQQLNSDLDKYLRVDVSDNYKLSHQLVSVTKMTVFLLCYVLEIFETRNFNVSDVKGGGEKNKQTEDLYDIEWGRNFALVCLDQLVQLQLHRIWSPLVVEQDFVNLISNNCYKILEDPVISHISRVGQ